MFFEGRHLPYVTAMTENSSHRLPAPAGPLPAEISAELLHQLAAKRGEFLAFVERRVGNRALAEDILQEAYAKSASKLADLNDAQSASAWFFRVLRNASAESFRRHARRDRALTAAEVEAEMAAREPAPDEASVGCRCVGALVDTLRPDYAEALSRVEVEGVAVKEFAAEQGISPNNAAVRVHRARKALAREVANKCGHCASMGCGDCTCGHE
jgi:RNA polymerase sigma-70 factor (ECF subfamily)